MGTDPPSGVRSPRNTTRRRRPPIPIRSELPHESATGKSRSGCWTALLGDPSSSRWTTPIGSTSTSSVSASRSWPWRPELPPGVAIRSRDVRSIGRGRRLLSEAPEQPYGLITSRRARCRPNRSPRARPPSAPSRGILKNASRYWGPSPIRAKTYGKDGQRGPFSPRSSANSPISIPAAKHCQESRQRLGPSGLRPGRFGHCRILHTDYLHSFSGLIRRSAPEIGPVWPRSVHRRRQRTHPPSRPFEGVRSSSGPVVTNRCHAPPCAGSMQS
jgi:hypothetical protein